jgi:hypothetical protein
LCYDQSGKGLGDIAVMEPLRLHLFIAIALAAWIIFWLIMILLDFVDL